MYVPVFLICCCIDVFHCNKECFRLLLGLYIVRNHDLTCLQNLVYLCIFHSVGTPDNNILIIRLTAEAFSFLSYYLILYSIMYYHVMQMTNLSDISFLSTPSRSLHKKVSRHIQYCHIKLKRRKTYKL